MRFILAFVSLLGAAFAQHNSFNIPPAGNYDLTAGQPQTFTWSNQSPGTVSLILRSGDRSNLQTVMTIASNLQNTGTYTWNVPSTIPEGANYAIEIVNDADSSDVNYTGQFVITSDVKAVATTGGSTSLVTATTAGTASASSMSMSMSMSMTSGASTTGTAATTMATSTGSHSGSSSAASSASGTHSSATSAASSAAAAVNTNAAAANGVKAASGLLAVAVGFAIAM